MTLKKRIVYIVTPFLKSAFQMRVIIAAVLIILLVKINFWVVYKGIMLEWNSVPPIEKLFNLLL